MSKKKCVSSLTNVEQEKLYREIASKVLVDIDFLAAMSAITGRRLHDTIFSVKQKLGETLQKEQYPSWYNQSMSPAPMDYMCINCSKVVKQGEAHTCPNNQPMKEKQ